MLWCCLRLPSLALDVYARSLAPGAAARPFAITTGGHYPRVVAASPAAAQAGVRCGQLISSALALAPDLVLRERDPQGEAEALAALAAWATQFTPALSVAPPDAVLAEIGGSLRLFGGLRRLAAKLTQGANDLGYTAQLAFAPTPTAALLLSRTGHAAPVTPAALESTLAPLPLAALEEQTEALGLLAAAGVRTFGQACALPRDALARRVGPAFLALLDRARGCIPDPRPPFVPPPRFERRLELPAAVESVDALAFAVHRLVQELAGWLLGRGLGIVGLTLCLAHERAMQRAGAPTTNVPFALAAPAREAAHLTAVLRERLARITLSAPVVAVTLASVQTAPLAGRNLGLLPGTDVPATVPLRDRLRARLGEDAITRVVPHAEHRPERAWEESGVGHHFLGGDGSGARKEVVFARRPLWLLAEPMPLGEALESKPWVLRDGPERIESGWWDGHDVRRDYFVATNPRGETVWIYRDHRYGVDDGEWFLHGLFA